ncbi:MAG: tetratricopeptide repeat protein [Flavobacteriales bacterium]|nr:tetratricopeptide repeat protein [Flavobacteriales bacterium]
MPAFRIRPAFVVLLNALLISSGCGSPSATCANFFEPYPDLITGRVRTAKNGAYLDAMALYGKGNYAEAAPLLRTYLNARDAHDGAHLYLACCLLATGQPFEAELELDHLERSNLKDFRDQTEWYTVLCWLCSDQKDRALEGARDIAAKPRHTYAKEADALVKALQ